MLKIKENELFCVNKAILSIKLILINDNGPGVKADDIPHLERRFFRADDSRSTQGNGLGLSLVSAIVSMHDGHLWFIHDPMMQGHGLGVVFSFPRSSGS